MAVKLSESCRTVWLYLFHQGGHWTAAEVARELGQPTDATFNQLTGMARRGLVQKVPPAPGTRQLRYGVTGTCIVPVGLTVAEVQL